MDAFPCCPTSYVFSALDSWSLVHSLGRFQLRLTLFIRIY